MKQKTCVRAPGFEDGKAVGVRYSSGTETPIITNSNLIGWGNFPNTVGFQAGKKKKSNHNTYLRFFSLFLILGFMNTR